MPVIMDDCKHGLPQFLCRRCDGNDRTDPAVSLGLAGQMNPDNDEQIKIADQGGIQYAPPVR